MKVALVGRFFFSVHSLLVVPACTCLRFL